MLPTCERLNRRLTHRLKSNIKQRLYRVMWKLGYQPILATKWDYGHHHPLNWDDPVIPDTLDMVYHGEHITMVRTNQPPRTEFEQMINALVPDA
jgi:hypothetical protein